MRVGNARQIVVGTGMVITGGPHHRRIRNRNARIIPTLHDVGVVLGRRVATGEIFVDDVTEIGDQRFRRQRLAGVVCRTVGLATAALRASVKIEHVLPREVFDGAGAKVLIGLVLGIHHRVDVDGP